jgi:NADH-quinone oxidoreductase subunit L
VTLVVVAIGVGISVWLFGPRRDIPVTQPESRSFLTLAGRNDLYGDPFNEAVFMRPGQRLTSGLVRLEDFGIDGTVNGTAAAIGGMSARLRRVQNGFVRSYALTMTLGAAIVGVVIVLGRLG